MARRGPCGAADRGHVLLSRELPRFDGGYLFSTDTGKTPVWMSSKIKRRLDQRMLRTLRALARQRGDDPAKVQMPAWTNHDIRRTVRSNLSRLKVSEEAREAVMAHVRPGIKGTYDLHDYLDEKREALDLWAADCARSWSRRRPTSWCHCGVLLNDLELNGPAASPRRPGR